MTTQSDSNLPKIDQPPAATSQGQKIWLSAFLIVFTILISIGWFNALDKLEGQPQAEYKAPWTAPSNATLRPGPPSFTYDRANNLLLHKGTIDEKAKKELISLLITTDDNPDAILIEQYADAINNLAYESIPNGSIAVVSLLMLGGWSAMLGVQLRSAVNFVNIVCYKKTLDAPVWWPWYVIRPLAGFLIGFIVVLLVKAEVLFKGESAAGGSLWWAGVAVLAGFGATEFTDRLRLLTQTLFGEGDSKSRAKT